MADEADIDLVLVTGAGASRSFGVGGQPLPLMGDWANFLAQRLMSTANAIEATGLHQGMTGPEFEATLGEFLSRVEGFYRAEGLIEVSGRFPQVQIMSKQLMEWYRNAKAQFKQITGQIQGSVYDQFHDQRLNGLGASESYGAVFQVIGLNRSNKVVYATTNYDALGEMALDRLGFIPDAGDTERYTGQNHLQFDHLLDGMPRNVPVLHLHGKVGWLRRVDGMGVDPAPYFTRTARYDPNYGIPILMLPDPNKTYSGDDVLTLLWSQFQTALRRAKRVLVIGHSLQDRLIVEALRDNIRHPRSLAVCFLSNDGRNPDQSAVAFFELCRTTFPQAAMIPMQFGGNPEIAREELASWVGDLHGLGVA